uniref:Uncharacterized protein n=1 Tax=Melopsittacus undulatus TaxID=13146 RepID=A0A8V5FS74_MELUD
AWLCCIKMVQFHISVEFLLKTPMWVFFSSQINIKNAEKVSTINKAFAEVQKEIQQISKGTAAEPEKSHQVISLYKNLRKEMNVYIQSTISWLLRLQAIHAVDLEL